jgi:hypothetical protein
MSPKITHIISMMDDSKTQYSQGMIVKTTACTCIEHAHNLARNWMQESTNLNHSVHIAQVIETHQLETTVKVSKP